MTRRGWFALALVVLVTGTTLHAWFGDSMVDINPLYRGAHAQGSDDAYIAYRYARNLAEGQGLVFNPGERVEGYSSALYTLAMAVAFSVTDDAGIYPLSVALNVLLAIAALWLFCRIVFEQLGQSAASLAGLLFAASPSLWIWVASGLETSLVLWLQLTLWLGVSRATDRPEKPHVGLLCCGAVALTLARADGFVFVGAVVAYLAVRRCWTPALVCAVACAATLGAHVLWRLDYYGYPFPNTYYAKVAGPPVERAIAGIKRLLTVGFYHYPSLVFYLSVLTWVHGRVLTSQRRQWAGVCDRLPFQLAVVPPLLVYWIWIGGDYFGDRFLLILYPIGILTVLELAHRRSARARRFAVASVAAVQLSAILWSPMFTYRADRYDYWIELASYLSERYSHPTLAIDAAGKVPFFTRWRTTDMLGLNDAFIGHKRIDSFGVAGHNKYDADYVLTRHPDLIAAWIDRDLNMNYGMEREKYRPAGYELQYVMNASLRRAAENVIDVGALGRDDIQRLFDAGYVYGVLVREGAPLPSGTSRGLR